MSLGCWSLADAGTGVAGGGIKIAKATYPTRPIPPKQSANTTNPTLPNIGSRSKYSATPPASPNSFLSLLLTNRLAIPVVPSWCFGPTEGFMLHTRGKGCHRTNYRLAIRQKFDQVDPGGGHAYAALWENLAGDRLLDLHKHKTPSLVTHLLCYLLCDVLN